MIDTDYGINNKAITTISPKLMSITAVLNFYLNKKSLIKIKFCFKNL